MPINMNAGNGISHQDELLLTGSTPTLRFTDTDTGADSYLTASSSGGALSLMADSGNESSTTKIYFACDGDEVGHFRGNNSYVGSLRLFPVRSNSTDQGIFFGTEASDGTGDWSNRRVIHMDTSNVVHINADSSTSGPLQIGTSNVTASGNFTATDKIQIDGNTNPYLFVHDITNETYTGIFSGDTVGALTFNHANFKVKSGVSMSGTDLITIASDGDTTFAGAVKVTKNLERTYTTVTHSSNTHTCDLSVNDNFIINANAATNTIALTIADANIGQAGNIVIVNASSGTVAFAALPSYMLTPDSATINFVTANNAVSLFSYLVIPDDGAGNRRVLVNYVGNFG